MANDECFCIGRAIDEICDDHLPLLHEDCRAKLAEARALLKTAAWMLMGDGRPQDELRQEIKAWLAANPGTEAK